MAKRPAEQIAEVTAEPLTKGGEAAGKIVKGNAEALTVSGNASRAAVQELTRAYQELATKNAKNLTAAMQALAAVKSRRGIVTSGKPIVMILTGTADRTGDAAVNLE